MGGGACGVRALAARARFAQTYFSVRSGLAVLAFVFRIWLYVWGRFMLERTYHEEAPQEAVQRMR